MKDIGSVLIRVIWLLLITLACAHDTFTLSDPRYFNHPVDIFIDEKFTQDEEQMIKKAFHSWEHVTSNKVQFNLHFGEREPGYYYLMERPIENSGVFVWQLDTHDYSDPNLTPELQVRLNKYQGYYIEGSNAAYILILFRHNYGERFYGVTLHEIGHMLGLSHADQKDTHSLMHPSTGANCVTVEDAERVCEIYNCIPRPECP